MQVLMIRHSKTKGNEEHKYIGSTDQPLSENGVNLAEEAARVYAGEFKPPEIVYVTPLIRTQMTAKILFPDAHRIVVDGLREMNFGVFENRSAKEMEADPEYKTWLDGMCEDTCPGGEKKSEFSERVCRAFASVIHEAREKMTGNIEASDIRRDAADAKDRDANDTDTLVMVLHGGTIMSICERYALPKRSFYDIFLTNCQGMLYDVVGDGDELRLINEKVFFRKKEYQS